MKLERLKELPALKQDIIKYLCNFVSRKPYDHWWKYSGEFKYEGKTYNLECECKMDNEMFTYRNLHIEHKQEVIDLTNPEHIAKYFGTDFLQ